MAMRTTRVAWASPRGGGEARGKGSFGEPAIERETDGVFLVAIGHGFVVGVVAADRAEHARVGTDRHVVAEVELETAASREQVRGHGIGVQRFAGIYEQH